VCPGPVALLLCPWLCSSAPGSLVRSFSCEGEAPPFLALSSFVLLLEASFCEGVVLPWVYLGLGWPCSKAPYPSGAALSLP